MPNVWGNVAFFNLSHKNHLENKFLFLCSCGSFVSYLWISFPPKWRKFSASKLLSNTQHLLGNFSCFSCFLMSLHPHTILFVQVWQCVTTRRARLHIRWCISLNGSIVYERAPVWKNKFGDWEEKCLCWWLRTFWTCPFKRNNVGVWGVSLHETWNI